MIFFLLIDHLNIVVWVVESISSLFFCSSMKQSWRIQVCCDSRLQLKCVCCAVDRDWNVTVGVRKPLRTHKCVLWQCVQEDTKTILFSIFFCSKEVCYIFSPQYFVAVVEMRFVVLWKHRRVLALESTFIFLCENESCRGDKHGRCFCAVGCVLLHFL